MAPDKQRRCEEFGQFLVDVLAEAKLTQVALAKLSGVPAVTISILCCGKRGAEVATIEKICFALPRELAQRLAAQYARSLACWRLSEWVLVRERPSINARLMMRHGWQSIAK